MGNDRVVDPAARDKYLLQVTAGPSYDLSTHQDIPVNGPSNTTIDSPLLTSYLKVRIKDYHGLPHGSPSTCPYFQHKLHTSDRYSIAFSFIPKRDLKGQNMVIGFDYDHSIKHQLPPGFKYAMKIATSMLDPGLYSDAYCDEPYLYGPALSGLFTLNIGDMVSSTPADEQLSQLESSSGVVEEGSSYPSGAQIRCALDMPTTYKKRRKFFLKPENLAAFTFQKARIYHADFFNPYLDFANFALKLPGFSISVARYIDEKTHHLRYVLKDRETGEVGFVVVFRLLFGEEMERVVREKEGEVSHDERGEESVECGAVSGQMPASEDEDIKINKQPMEKKIHTQHTYPTADDSSEEDSTSSSSAAAVTSLSNSIHAVFVAMGLWDDDTCSSDEDAPSPSSESLNSRLDNMNNSTVEKFLQSRQSNV